MPTRPNTPVLLMLLNSEDLRQRDFRIGTAGAARENASAPPPGSVIPSLPSTTPECSVATLLRDLAQVILPDWLIVVTDDPAHSISDRIRASLPAESSAEVPDEELPRPLIAIADAFYSKLPPDQREVTTVAFDWLLKVRTSHPQCSCILTATLPESPEIIPQSDAHELTAFIPLANTNVNAWDEFFNLLRDQESRRVFEPTLPEGTDAATLSQFLEALERDDSAAPTRVFDSDIVIDGSGMDGREEIHLKILDHLKHRGLTLTGIVINGRLIVRHCELRHVRIRDSSLFGPVLFYNVRVSHRSYLSSNYWAAHLNCVHSRFESSLVVEHNQFSACQRRPAEGVILPELMRHRMPWFSHCDVTREFVYRNNRAIEPAGSLMHTVMFHECTFDGRVDFQFSNEPTKLAIYASRLKAGHHVDISFPYILADESGRLRHGQGVARQEVRLCMCEIGARVSLRESPAALTNEDLRLLEGDITNTNHTAGHRPPPYTQAEGIGLNLYGSVLTGVVNLRDIRVCWINCERLTVSGGSIMMHEKAFSEGRTPGLAGTHRESLASVARRSAFLSPERVSLVFEERMIQGHEEPRFTYFFAHSGRYLELSVGVLRKLRAWRSIAQQYEDLRKALSNGSNSQRHEDFCHYKRMMYTGMVDREIGRQNGDLRRVAEWMAGSMAAGFAVVCVLWFLFSQDPAFFWSAFWYAQLFGATAVIVVSRRGRSVMGTVLDQFVNRHLLGYLAYPSRVLLTGVALMLLFAIAYSGFDAVSYRANHPRGSAHIHSTVALPESSPESLTTAATEPPSRSLQLVIAPGDGGGHIHVKTGEAASPPKPASAGADSAVAHWIDSFPRMLHFSVVTFTTLGYGDELPQGPLRPVANLEAVLGALWISMFTVAIARQVIRN